MLRRIMVAGVAVLCTGLVLWLAAALLGWPGLRAFASYTLLAGFALLLLHLAARLQPDSGSASKPDPSLYGKDTTAFSQLESRTDAPEPEPAPRGGLPPAATWNAQVFRDIEWRRFEIVCACLFAQAGFEARTQSHGAEGGIDIWLYTANGDKPTGVAQCRHWLGRPVQVRELRAFYEVMHSGKLLRGTFATTGPFSGDARDYAKSHGITALDGLGLLALISQRTAAQKKELLEIAYEGEYWRPTCSRCGIKMVERREHRKDRSFWGCPDYPRCDFTLPTTV